VVGGVTAYMYMYKWQTFPSEIGAYDLLPVNVTDGGRWLINVS